MDADRLELSPSVNQALRVRDIYLPLEFDQIQIDHMEPWMLVALSFA